jgi:hypothetical protein
MWEIAVDGEPLLSSRAATGSPPFLDMKLASSEAFKMSRPILSGLLNWQGDADHSSIKRRINM